MAVSIPSNYEVIIYQQKSNQNWGTQTAAAQNSQKVIKAWLPEEFTYQMTSNYESPFQQVLGNPVVGSVAGLMGKKLMSPVMTAQMWTGSETPELSLELQFETEDDPIRDVKQPILDLLDMVTPTVDSIGMLNSPGPSILPSQSLANLFDTVKSLAGGVWGTAKGTVEASTVDTAKQFTQGQLIDSSKTLISNRHAMVAQTYTGTGDGNRTLIGNQISMAIGRYLFFPSIVITSVSTNILHLIEQNSGFPMSANVTLEFKPMFLPIQYDNHLMFGA